jgi:hypothetical protein
MTTMKERLTNYLIGIENALQVQLGEFEITNQKSTKTPEHQIVFEKTGSEVGLRILPVVGTGTVKYVMNGQPATERNADLVTARIGSGKKETLVPVFMLKQNNPSWAWLEEGDARIPFSAIQRTVEHCESLYQGNAQAAAAPAR